MKVLCTVLLCLLAVVRTHAEAKLTNRDTKKMWWVGIGLVKAPNGDGSMASLQSPQIWTKGITGEQNNGDVGNLGVNLCLNWQNLRTMNMVVNPGGNYTDEATQLLSLNSIFSMDLNGNNVGFIDVGYGQVIGAHKFSSDQIDGMMLGIGVVSGAMKLELVHFATNDRAEKISGHPNVFGGTYVAASFNFNVHTK